MTASVLNKIRKDGYGIYKDFYDASTIEKLSELCDKHMRSVEFTNADGEKITVKSGKNLAKTTRDFDEFFADPRLVSIYERILQPVRLWGMKLSDTSFKNVVPGMRARALHRDDDVYPHLAVGRPFTANALLALDPFSEAVGSTNIVPGSHLWEHEIDQDQEAIPIEMEPGDLLILDGRTWHGHGVNTTEDQRRRAINVYYCDGWCQPGHGPRCGMSNDEYAKVPEALKRFM